ncbi:HAMP domain-containing histidine kinase [candidate division WWE3 bacterium]|uniref:histidine kinase n=1 Tax=candidate division WWE3 bacterium TaxID=2053526 RepID=A0A955RR15_UNCKA|nr:HAMP domain-containing histidine kinase [candidate division WWE3 bacterium]
MKKDEKTPLSQNEIDDIFRFRKVMEVSIYATTGFVAAVMAFWAYKLGNFSAWTFNVKFAILVMIPGYVLIFFLLHHVMPKKIQVKFWVNLVEVFIYIAGLYFYILMSGQFDVNLGVAGTLYFLLFYPLFVMTTGYRARMVVPGAIILCFFIALDVLFDHYLGTGKLVTEIVTHPLAMFGRIMFLVLFAFFSRYLVQEAWQQKEARARLEQLDKERTIFIEFTAHELRTPLTVIKGNLSVLEMALEGKDKETEYVQNAGKSVEELRLKVEKLFQISELENDQWLSEKEPTDLVALVKSKIDEFKKMAEDKGVTLVDDLPSKPVKVVMKDELMAQAFGMLIDNAIRYNEKGVSVHVGLEEESDKLSGEVTDDGVGVPKEEVPNLFKKFYRVLDKDESILNMPESGMGLGLYLSRLIFEAHGGSLDYDTDNEKGARFVFTLPLKKDEYS